MPAPVVVVHNEPDTRELAVIALQAAGHKVADFADPIQALNAIRASGRARILITRIDFGPERLHGLALAQMVRSKQQCVQALFSAGRKTSITQMAWGCSCRCLSIRKLWSMQQTAVECPPLVAVSRRKQSAEALVFFSEFGAGMPVVVFAPQAAKPLGERPLASGPISNITS